MTPKDAEGRAYDGVFVAFDLAIPDRYGYLVIHDGGGIGWSGTDRDRAHEYARHTGSVVAKLPLVGDYRPESSHSSGTVGS